MQFSPLPCYCVPLSAKYILYSHIYYPIYYILYYCIIWLYRRNNFALWRMK
jgi:hypothetical protein